MARLAVLVGVLVGICCSLWLSGDALAQRPERHIRRGNSAYADGEYKEAELEYRQALNEDKGSRKATFNLADAQYEQGRYSEAEKLFGELLQDGSQQEAQEAATWYNLGNTYYKQEKYQESADAYKTALKLEPGHAEAKYNLSEALRQLAGRQNQQQNQQNQDKQQDQQDQNSQQNQQENRDNQQDQQNQDNQQSQQQDEQQNQQQRQGQDAREQQQQGQAQQLTQEEAAQLLKALENQEEKLQAKMRAKQNKGGVRRKSDKDW